MATELTINIDDEKLKRIKLLSEKKGKSVSELFEDFIDEAEKKERAGFDINNIAGAFGKEPENFDADKIRWEYLKEKHGL